ncbi:hypothetical protein B9Z55_024623 [Caenorhabditis nigoni]|uniref:Uncharacterized protein n=1 Tax=Caenorhabditis nigoni TaxID=1611254 RepID=A0A2G5SVB8_9PELO|nr:hypothetical protein B9Z55_024623 [Caenorhabditis nigoni]
MLENHKVNNLSAGTVRFSEASSPQHSQFSPETPTAIISLLRAKNKENLEAWHQECEMHLKYLYVMQKTWNDNDLRMGFQNTLSEAIEHFENRLVFIDELKASKEIVAAAQKTFEEKQREYEMKRSEKIRMEGNMNDSFLGNSDAEKLRNEYSEYSKNFTDAFLETHQAKTNLNNQRNIWNETASMFNEATTQVEAKNESYQILEEKWSSLMSVLKDVTDKSSDPQNNVSQELSLMEKILQTPPLSALELNLSDRMMLSEIKAKERVPSKVPSTARIISYYGYFSKMDWEKRYSLTYVTEKESSAIQELIPILEVLKSHNFRREICEVLTEAVALQTEKMDQITKLKILANSVSEAERVFSNKDAEFELSTRHYKECLNNSEAYFKSEDYASLVKNTEKQVELAKKLEQAREEVQRETDDLNMQKEAMDEMIKKITEIEETFVKNQMKLMKLEKNWSFIEKIVLSVERQNQTEVDKEKKNQLLVKFLESPLLISEQVKYYDFILKNHVVIFSWIPMMKLF